MNDSNSGAEVSTPTLTIKNKPKEEETTVEDTQEVSIE